MAAERTSATLERWQAGTGADVFHDLNNNVAWETDADSEYLVLYDRAGECDECEGNPVMCCFDWACPLRTVHALEDLPMHVIDGLVLMVQTLGWYPFSDIEEHRAEVERQRKASIRERVKG